MRKLWLVATALLLVLSLCLGVTAADIEEEIIRGCREEDWINLREFQISEEDFEELFFQMRNDGKFPWYVDYSYSYYTDDDGIMTSYKPDFLNPKIYDRLAYELAVAELIHQVIHPGMTHTQMALAVHDYLITHCAYDESLEKNTGYDLLINGTTICAGYSELYMDILTRLGIPCVCVESDPMDHAWNLVHLEDSWYHVDVTWDDPTPDTHGQVEHTYFLLSDAQIRQMEDPHYDWVTDKVCDSDRYTDAFWRDVYAPIWYLDADICILRKENADYCGTVYTYQESTGKLTKLATNRERYVSIGYGAYAYWHTGVSIWNDRLYFNDVDTVYSTNLQGKDRRKEYSHKTWQEKNFIIGSFVENDVLYLSFSDHDFEQVTNREVALAPSGYHTHSYDTKHVDAGCETPESTLHYCSCGVEYAQPIGPVKGHMLTETSIQGNMLQLGCRDCDRVYEIKVPEVAFLRWLPEMIEKAFG